MATRRIRLVWLALVAATCLSLWLGSDHGGLGPTGVTAVVLTVAFVKVRLVGIHFMELGRAPRPLRGFFEAYVLVLLSALLVLYVAL